MRIGEKINIIELLEELRVLNYKSAYMYQIIGQNEKRLMLKNFYNHLHQQKIDFQKDIEEKIEQLKKEISPIEDSRILSFYKRKKCELNQYYLKYKLKYTYANVQKHELEGYRLYKDSLSKINHASVREILLNHKYEIKTNLGNMSNTGLTKFPAV